MLNEFSRVKQQSPPVTVTFHFSSSSLHGVSPCSSERPDVTEHQAHWFSLFFQLHPFVGLFDACAGVARRAGYGGHRGSRPARGHGATIGLHPPSKYPALQSAVSAALAAVERRCCVAGMWRK